MRILLSLLFSAFVLMCVAIIQGPLSAAVQAHADESPSAVKKDLLRFAHKDRESRAIIAAIESRMDGRHLPEKAWKKLSVMNEEEIRLLSSLCDRMSHAEDAGSDIAAFLAAAVIVLS